MLFEVMVSIAIISCAMIFVVHSFYASKRTMQRSVELTTISALLDNKMSELIMGGEISAGSAGGVFPYAGEYSWNTNASPIEGTGLNLVTVEVYGKDGGRGARYAASTYLRKKANEGKKS